MIIKTINSQSSFGQLYDYIVTGAKKSRDFTFFHNLSGGTAREVVLKEFEDNNAFRKRVKTPVVHDILSWEKDANMTDKQLLRICQKYIAIRCPEAIVYAKVHRESHIHVHMMISGNKLMQDKSVRLNKADYMSIRREIEEFQVKELGIKHSIVYNREKSLAKRKQMVLTKSKSKKNTLLKTVDTYAQKARNMSHLAEMVDEHPDMHIYSRGNKKNYGIIYNEKRWRLNRLLDSEMFELLHKLDSIERFRQQKEHTKEKIMDRKQL